MKLQCPSCWNVMTVDTPMSDGPVRCSQCAALLGVPKEAVAAVTASPPAAAVVGNPDDDVPLPRRPRPQPAPSSSTTPILLIVGGVAVLFFLMCLVPVGLGVMRFFLERRAMEAEVGMADVAVAKAPFDIDEEGIFLQDFEVNGAVPPVLDPNPPAIFQPVPFQVARLDEFIADSLRANDQVGPLAPDSKLWGKIAAGIKENRLQTGPVLDDRLGAVNFRETGPDDGILIGFFASAPNNACVHYMQPIFLTPKGEKVGKRYGSPSERVVCIKARRGHAVGAINVRSGDLFDGFTVTFMRVQDERLDRNDAYRAVRVGGLGGIPARLGGDGSLIVGIHGWTLGQANIAPAGSITSLGVLSLK